MAITVALLGCAPHARAPEARPPTAAKPGAAAPRALDEAELLDKQVEELFGQGKLQDAVPLAERSLALRTQVLGPRHLDVGITLGNLAFIYGEQGMYTKAEPLLLQALEIRVSALGPAHPDVGKNLNDLGAIYQKQGAYAKAEEFYRRGLEVAEQQSQGAPSEDVAASLTNLAAAYELQGVYAKSEPLHLRALDIMEKTVGTAHPQYAAALNNLAMLYQQQAAYSRAEPLLLRALEIEETALGPLHSSLASTLSNLAGNYEQQGAYAKAELLVRRALEIREKALGPTHPAVAVSLNNLANLYRQQGAYAKAEPLWGRALQIAEAQLGPMHPSVANSLHNLALLYQLQGAYAKAEPLFVRALDIKQKALGGSHPDVAGMLSSLAALYQDEGAYAKAEPLYVRALEITQQALGPMHPDIANNLNSLAVFYDEQGAYARAEPLYIRAFDIWEKALGPTHPAVATGVNNLAMHYLALRAYAQAEPLLVRALVLREQHLGELHPDVAVSVANLAGLYEAQGAYAQTVPLLARAAELQEANLRRELPRLSESRKRALMLRLGAQTERVVSLHAHAVPTDPQALELAFTTVLRRKGRILDSLVDSQAALRAHLTPPLRGKLGELTDANAQLSISLREPFDPKTAERRRSQIAALRERIDKLEAELNTASVDFRAQTEPVTVAKIQAALPRSAALVEIVRYRRFDPRSGQGQQRWREARYLAYLLPSRGAAQWVALGEAAQIDAGVDDVLAAMRKDASLGTARDALRRLDALVLAPIRARLPGVSHLIVSPDGKLNLVPFDALIDPQGRYAVEQQLVSYMTSGRDLLRFAARQPAGSPPTIIADPDYGPPGKSYLRVDGTIGGAYGRLAGTSVEADGVRGYLVDARTLTQGKATTAALTALAGPSVLHIATHGFYARALGAGAPPPPAPRERGMSIEATPPLPPAPPSEDPTEALDRAGLALAGANLGPEGSISARELAGLDWSGTQLVVLSACETGVGVVPSGEGVYGMRRALVLAGARSQVVSLWNVNDSSAPELMRELYAALARGVGRAEALRQAKLRILRQPRFAHPYYWAAFIPAGDWTALDPGAMKPAPPAQPATDSALRRRE